MASSAADQSRRASFKVHDLRRALRAAQAEGWQVARAIISPDGRIEIMSRADDQPQGSPESAAFDRWKARRAS